MLFLILTELKLQRHKTMFIWFSMQEEEDEYDKVAVCKEKAEDRLYMKDINGYWTDINFYDELPNTFEDVTRDPRANHLAAKLRLKEDAEAAGKFDTLRVSDSGSNLSNIETNTAEDGLSLKSILKRKENEGDMKSQKRVRFDPGCKNYCEEEFEEAEDVVTDNCSMEEAKILEASSPPPECSRVPGYILNPSKYTHYTFDSSSDIDEESNQKACMDFLHQLKRSNSADLQPVTSMSLPKSITFTPKKKLVDDASTVKNNDGFKQNREDSGKERVLGKGCPIGIAAGEARESAICAMEEDEPEKASTKNSSLQRQSRQYRTRANIGSDEPIT